MSRGRIRADHDTPRPGATRAAAAVSAENWSASLEQPTVARHDSQEALAVSVTGPASLSRVQVGVEPRGGGAQRWTDATKDDGGRWVVLLGAGELRLAPGRYAVLARPSYGGQRPVLHAGRLIIQ